MNDVSRSFRGNSNASRDIAHHLHPYTNFKKHENTGPLTIVRGRGVYVMDDDGKEYIEGMAGLWSAALGFSNERLATVAYEQMKQLPFYHAFNQRSHEPAINLAEKLKSMAPVADVEGVLRQLRLRGQRHRREDGLVHEQRARPSAEEEDRRRVKGYHGVTVASASLTGLPANHRSFDLPIQGVLHTTCPHFYRFGKSRARPRSSSPRAAPRNWSSSSSRKAAPTRSPR
jgi:4-aminobutyrate--pyruvate transaminase